jgi:DNA-binding MarR family transcriptional regulator
MTRWAVTRSASANGGQGGARGRVRMSPPPDLVAAPGYGARRLYQAYLAAWNRHVDAVLTGPQFAVLSAIRAHPDVDQTALAGAVALDTSTRTAAPHDARAKVLTLTEDGAAALTETNRRARALDEALLDGCPPEQRPQIASLLNDLGQQWERVAERDAL